MPKNLFSRPAAASLLLAVFILPIFGCAAPSADVLSYQSLGAYVSGICDNGAGTFYINITLEPMKDSTQGSIQGSIQGSADTLYRDAVINYTYPDDVAGLTVELTNGNATLCYDGMTIPVSESAAAGFKRIISLFTLDRDDITSLECEGNFITVKLVRDAGDTGGDTGGNTGGGDTRADYITLTLDGESSLPSRISIDGGESGMALDFEIREYKIAGDAPED